MLRCSTSIFAIAICFVCPPALFGQVFLSQLDDALQTQIAQSATSAPRTSTTVKKQIRQRPWLSDTTPNKPSLDVESVTGPRLKPSFVPQPRLTPTNSTSKPITRVETKSDAVTATASSQEKVSVALSPQETSLTRQPNLSEIDPAIRREIEERVRRDLETKFDSKIQSLVKQQVRQQVRDARYQMERAARSNRVASRPISNSTYRVAGARREPPTVTGEVLPLIVADDSQKPQLPTNPAEYLLTSTVSGPEVESNVYTPPRNSNPTTNRRVSQAGQYRFRDGAQFQPESGTEAVLMAKESRSPVEAKEFARTESALAGNSEPISSEQLQEFYLRASVIGPGTSFKNVSDSYGITVSNISNQPATNVIVQLTVPEAITISKLDRDAYLDQKLRTVSWKVASIGSGQQEVIRYRAVSSSTGTYKQEVRLGMENIFQGKTPFETIVQAGTPQLPVATETKKDCLKVAERLDLGK